MHTLNLMEFTGYSNDDMLAYLNTVNETSFRIVLKRNYKAPEDDMLMIANEYFNAMFLGQSLSELSPNFGYNVPSEYSVQPFLFELSTANMHMLAFFLVYFIRGLEKDMNTNKKPGGEYHVARETFLKQYLEDQIYPACHGLIYKMDKLLR